MGAAPLGVGLDAVGVEVVSDTVLGLLAGNTDPPKRARNYSTRPGDGDGMGPHERKWS
jgi:hypothetical protein